MLAQNSESTTETAGEFPLAAKKSAGGRVLVVDDERLLRWSVGETLSARGYEVAEAGDGRSALETFGAGDATDLVLLDLRLPDVDDLRVLQRLRTIAPRTPVILMTAFATREIVEGATALGATVMSKPFDLDALAAAVERVLSGRVY